MNTLQYQFRDCIPILRMNRVHTTYGEFRKRLRELKCCHVGEHFIRGFFLYRMTATDMICEAYRHIECNSEEEIFEEIIDLSDSRKIWIKVPKDPQFKSFLESLGMDGHRIGNMYLYEGV